MILAGGMLADGLPDSPQEGEPAACPQGGPPGGKRGLMVPSEGAPAVGSAEVRVGSDLAGCDGKGIGV